MIAGDIDAGGRRRQLVEKWFGDIPRSAAVEPLRAATRRLAASKRRQACSRTASSCRALYLTLAHAARASRPATRRSTWSRGVLAGGKNSRLYKRLVYEMQIAQDVSAYQDSRAPLTATFLIVATARPGHDARTRSSACVDEEIARLRRRRRRSARWSAR